MKRMMVVTAVALVALALASPAVAQEFWDKKPYTEWNKNQCKKLLEDAPWSAHQGARDVQNLAFSKASTGGEETEKRIDYYAQLRSALPVRQAFIRKMMLDMKYDKLAADQKKAFDDSAGQYLARQYPDVVVVAVEYSTNVEVYDRELARHWQTVEPAGLLNQVFLTARKGVRVNPIKYEAERGAGRSFQLVFKRTLDNGEPILGPGDKLVLELPAPTFEARSNTEGDPQINDPGAGNRGASTNPNAGPGARGLKESRLVFEFKSDKMKYKGDLTY